jgi:competence protein ComEC
MDKMLLKMDEIDIFTISFSKLNIILIIIYYVLLILCKNSKKYYIGIICLLLIFYLNGLYVINPKVYFLDVGQGDSSLIRYKNKNYLIDTGGITNYQEEWKKRKHEYSISNDLIIPFSRSIGVKKIDYLIITHGDYDHMGDATNIVNNMNVKKIIFNCGEINELEEELLYYRHYSCIDKLDFEPNLYFLNTKTYDNENDNSNVVYMEYYGYKFLFMGDASMEREKEIIDKYNINDIDVLKVGHHGSKTSSSVGFINIMKPKYSIISVGKNNKYGHPNKEVLNNLKESKVYRTDRDGSIRFKILNNYMDIKVYSP